MAAPVERKVHADILTYLRAVLPREAYVHHSMNEGKRGFRAQGDVKALGMRKGHPDIEFFVDGRAYFIEVKRPPPAKTYLSADQSEAHAALQDAGCEVAVARSIEDARAALRAWNITTREKA